MRMRNILKRYSIPVVSVVFFFLWLSQQSNIGNRTSYVDETDIRNGQDGNSASVHTARIHMQRNNTRNQHNQQTVVKSNASFTRRPSTAMSEYIVTIPVKRLTSTRSPSTLKLLSAAVKERELLNEMQSDSELNQHLEPSDKGRLIINSTNKAQQKANNELKYDARENLLFIENVAKINFVKVNISSRVNITSGIEQKHSQLTESNTGLYHNWKSSWTVPKGTQSKQLETKPVNDAQEPDEELSAFANIPLVQDYELPLLKANDSSKAGSSNTDAIFDNKPNQVFVWPPVEYKNSTLSSPVNTDSGDAGNDDDIMSSAVIFGDIVRDKMYAVFSTTTDNREALGFIFLLPLTTLAWKRVGFESIIIVVGSVDAWNSNELYHFVLSTVRELGAVVIFLEPRPEKSVMISQKHWQA